MVCEILEILFSLNRPPPAEVLGTSTTSPSTSQTRTGPKKACLSSLRTTTPPLPSLPSYLRSHPPHHPARGAIVAPWMERRMEERGVARKRGLLSLSSERNSSRLRNWLNCRSKLMTERYVCFHDTYFGKGFIHLTYNSQDYAFYLTSCPSACPLFCRYLSLLFFSSSFPLLLHISSFLFFFLLPVLSLLKSAYFGQIPP